MRRSWPAHWLVYAISFLASYPMPATAPLLPFIARDLDVGQASVGMVMAAFALPCVVMTPLYGILADRVSRRALLVPCLFVYAAGTLACGLANDLEFLLAARFVQGTGGAALGLLNATLMGDLFSGRDRVRYMGRSFAAMCVGLILFPALAGLLAARNWRWAFFVTGACNIPVLLLFFFISLPRHDMAKPGYLGRVARVLSSRDAVLALAVMFLSTAASMGAVMTFFPVYAHERFGATSAAIGIAYATATAGTLLGALVMSFTMRLRPVRLLMLTCASAAAGLALFPCLPLFGLLLLPLALNAFNDGICQPTLNAMMADLADADVRSAVMAAATTMFRVSQAVTPVLFGLVLALWGYASLFLLASACLLVCAVLLHRGCGRTAGT